MGMNGYSLIAALVWAAVGCYAIVRAESFGRSWLASAHLRAQSRAAARAVSAEEVAKIHADALVRVAEVQAMPPAHRPSSPSRADIQLPDDLEAHVNTWGDEWARDDERTNLRARYLELHTGDPAETWQKVRRAVGLGEMP